MYQAGEIGLIQSWQHSSVGVFITPSPPYPLSLEVPEAQRIRVTLLEVTRLVSESAFCPPAWLWGQPVESSSGTDSLIQTTPGSLDSPSQNFWFPKEAAHLFLPWKEYVALPSLCSSNGHGIHTTYQQCFPRKPGPPQALELNDKAWDSSWIRWVAKQLPSLSIKWESWYYLARTNWDD